jgi:hypothetical protein
VELSGPKLRLEGDTLCNVGGLDPSRDVTCTDFCRRPEEEPRPFPRPDPLTTPSYEEHSHHWASACLAPMPCPCSIPLWPPSLCILLSLVSVPPALGSGLRAKAPNPFQWTHATVMC